MRDPLIVRLYLIWVFFLIFESIIPISGKYSDSKYIVYFYILVFLISMAIGVISGFPIKIKIKVKKRDHDYNRIISILSYLTILGACFVAYNRIFVQGIDYTQGISIAREQWKEASVNIGTSPFGPIGNIFLSGFLYVHVLLVIWKQYLTKKNIYLALFAGLIGLISEMIFTGGRSFLIIYISAIYIAILTRKKLKMKSVINPAYLAIILGISFLYAGYVFQLRAEMGGFSAETYAMNWIELLGGKEYPDIPEWLDLPITHISILVVSYLTHSIWMFEQVVTLDLHENYSMFTFIRFMGYKSGILPESIPWELSGFFVPLPGLIFHDFGLLAIPLISFILGFMYSITRNIFLTSQGVGSLFLYTLISIILILSPINFAFDLMLFFYLLLNLIVLKAVRII